MKAGWSLWVALTVAAAAVAPARPRAQGESASRLAAAGVSYVSTYQEQFAFLIADEVAVQRVASTRPASSDVPAIRTTRAEVFITYLPDRRHWTTVRDVTDVDGVGVEDRMNLVDLIGREDTHALARRLFAMNARYNIGRVARNFNDPMLGLLPLNATHRPRFSFDADGAGHRDTDASGASLLRFRERERPTLVRSTTNASVFARGEIVLEPGSGVVRRTRMTFKHDDIDAALETEFERESRLSLWVPVRFTERYVSSREGDREETHVESSYSNYRRFDVRARFIP